MAPLRILALHGFGQNATVFMEKRAKEVVRKLKAIATIHAIQAPHPLPFDESLMGWWQYPESMWDGRAETIQALAEDMLQRSEMPNVGMQESIDMVLTEWESGGYDGILGFSQGAVLAAVVVNQMSRRQATSSVPSPRFAILISGFGKPTPEGLEHYPPSEPLGVPSLHVWGSADDHIPPSASQALAAYFVNPKLHAHPGGHTMPQKAADCNVLVDFLAPFVREDSGANKGSATQSTSPAAKQQAKGNSGVTLASQVQSISVPRHEELGGAMLLYCGYRQSCVDGFS